MKKTDYSDDLYLEIKAYVRDYARISFNLLRRKFGVKTTAAYSIMDRLKSEGIIVPLENGRHKVVCLSEKGTRAELASDEKVSKWSGHNFKPGRPAIYEDAEDLWIECCEYFQWVEDNPILEEHVAFCGTLDMFGYHETTIPKYRPMIIEGLANHLGISKMQWHRMAEGRGEEFSRVKERADNIIYSTNFALAAAGLINANLISRQLGLMNKMDVYIENNSNEGKKTLQDFYNKKV